MAGVEVVGIVLATIPLVISAIEHYEDALQTINRWRSTTRELQSLKRRLGTQQAIFTNTCEHLLGGLVSATDLETMIADPFGPSWQDPDIKCKIEMRLDRVREQFHNTAKAMVEAVEQFKVRLDLDETGKVKWVEAKAIVRELRRATFIIRRSHYDDLLNSLSEGNQDLKTLTNQSLQLEPERKTSYQGRLLVLLRGISKKAYSAVLNNLQCTCSTSHGASLEMGTLDIKSTDKEQQVLHNSVFRCTFSYLPNQQGTEIDVLCWQRVLLKLDDSEKPAQSKPAHRFAGPLQTNGVRPKTSERLRRFKSVKFAMQSAFNSNAQVQSVIATQTQSNDSPDILLPSTLASTVVTAKTMDKVNICHIIRKQGKMPYTSCYGHIADQDVKENSSFGVYPPEPHEDSENIKFLSMKSILKGQGSKFPGISYRQKVKLAIDISSSLLQLNGTPWFPETLTSEDIFFLVRDGVPVYDRAFVNKGSLYTASTQPTANIMSQPRDIISGRPLFALGILLIEILLLETLDHVWTPRCYGEPTSMPMADQIKDWKGLKNFLDDVEHMAGSNYSSAVRRFLFCDFIHVNTSQNEEVIYKEIYGKTVALLMRDRSASESNQFISHY
ncbi:uncharacterized protein F4822DRAFT_420813 [Hypoxylon trugodes]|uniref:uncharacterized protein n=1 Tax=Hypoxylon trugodes TaxID=326681 RepID=UPI002198AE52|nr:uncharacterized protein F4822DRAFT_420813 [Hypoxylon trugodes]KAI1383487.1 hypothetical protein F4822DRAFT_420813 [Hypoxylon trugodes]